MSAQATRLESLFLLVRDGSSAQIRENAAEKLGEVAARAPDFCASILQQLWPLIVDGEWEIRVAASKCLDVVARSLRHEDENVADLFALVSRMSCPRRFGWTGDLGSHEASSAALNLQTVDINKVVQEGAPLLRSGGEEYQYTTNMTEEERRVHAVKQRRLLLKRLSGAGGPIWKTREDSLTKQLLPRLNRDHAQEIADDIEASEAQPNAEEEPTTATSRKNANDMLSIPARSKRRSDNGAVESRSNGKRMKVDHHGDVEDVALKSEGGNGKWINNSEKQTNATIVAGLVSDLFESMFDSKWEVRHGALLSLRQILLSAHFTAAVEAVRPAVDGARQRNFVDKWLEECLIRCICVLALDQFVDYSADGSISPVREVCAQVFGILLGSLSCEDTLVGYLKVVRTLFSGSTWQACHGGLLGLKYLVRAHNKHAQVLVPLFFYDIVAAFSHTDSEDDVLVLAADMFKDFVSFLNRVEHAEIMKAALLLWGSLKVHERAGMVTASIIQALSSWYNHPRIGDLLQSDTEVRAAIWQNLSYTVPMLHHHSKSVRASSATCVAAIFSVESSSSSQASFAQVFLPHLLFQVILERDESVQRSLLSAWKSVVSLLSKKGQLMPIVAEQLPTWITLLWSMDEIDCLNVEMVSPNGAVFGTEVSASVNRVARENVSSRGAFAEALGFSAAHVPLSSACMAELIQLVRDGVFSSSGERQCGVLLALSKWGYFERQLNQKTPQEQSRRIQYLQSSIGSFLGSFAENRWRTVQPDAVSGGKRVFYSEQLGSLKRVVQMEARIIDIYSSVGISIQSTQRLDSASTADISRQIAEHIALFPYEKLEAHPKEFEMAHFKRQDLFLVDELVQQSFSRFYHRIQGLGSSAYCGLLPIPSKSGFLVNALMNSIKEEEELTFRTISSQTIAGFVVGQAHIQKKCVAKIISNLCNSAAALVGISGDSYDTTHGGRSLQNDHNPSLPPDVLKKTKIRVAGAEVALSEIYRLAQLTKQPYEDHQTRRIVAHAVAAICKNAEGQHREDAMLVVYNSIFVVFSNVDSADSASTTEALEGAVMVLDRIVHTLGADLTPYIPSLVHYAMKTMSSQFKLVRTFAAGAFADLVPLIPLQMDLELRDSDQLLPDSLRTIVRQNAVSRKFLESFTEGKAVQHTDVTSWLATETSLRVYQQHGVDWLCFMAKNNLHGILADDMGLGKTLQTLSAMAATLGVPPAGGSKRSAMPCLIVCPPIIVHHWIQEAKKYIPGVFASIVDYSLTSSERKTLSHGKGIPISDGGPTMIVTTYSILRTDIECLSAIDYAFVVLDEAHLIRNPSTALFRAVLELHASHRVALSGTPLQNNVTDLWALFEFLMPGYLGDFALFRREFVLPITKSKARNATPKQKELAAIAITKLHQKVLPFILRRTKDQVLEELPPKIISNVLLPLSPLQRRLYSLALSSESEIASSVKPSRARKSNLREKNPDTKQLTNVLTNLQLLRKICVHPALVADDAVTQGLNSKEKGALRDWKSSGKMSGLRDLLVECCDIAAWDQGSRQGADENVDDSNISPHRCLVFAHLQKTLDLTEQMLRDALPGVTYRRLDGQTPHSKRADIVQHFNADPSIDVLLLTTAVGGLGLTLTGADTVIFIEHSWNPFVDLQAMDRAHRIGQKRTVRVFRLIMEESLEEHILNLQEFKEQVAATVVQKSDAQSSMNTSTKGVLNLLQTSSSAVTAQELRAEVATNEISEGGQRVAAALPQGAQELLDQIGELWDESQYESLAFPEATDD
ncbi:btaf1 RNA polymerase II, B-TFIID transcription factor-associated, 170kDa [Phytophthora pseudosyringae]|uniref:Btaf1 RNA polymerase II, B-TFIID transcription factor-associated, 170kDa n=1 Tax=Phytophthora pseudosyringae TaxID=221518 RepID=A0A8T1WG58_9STRA|nr:btaf1 RNA polymerase II, B-TFIID transcription factor-associated, 170kDa [Phytophthora pseudosyringae]